MVLTKLERAHLVQRLPPASIHHCWRGQTSLHFRDHRRHLLLPPLLSRFCSVALPPLAQVLLHRCHLGDAPLQHHHLRLLWRKQTSCVQTVTRRQELRCVGLHRFELASAEVGQLVSAHILNGLRRQRRHLGKH